MIDYRDIIDFSKVDAKKHNIVYIDSDKDKTIKVIWESRIEDDNQPWLKIQFIIYIPKSEPLENRIWLNLAASPLGPDSFENSHYCTVKNMRSLANSLIHGGAKNMTALQHQHAKDCFLLELPSNLQGRSVHKLIKYLKDNDAPNEITWFCEERFGCCSLCDNKALTNEKMYTFFNGNFKQPLRSIEFSSPVKQGEAIEGIEETIKSFYGPMHG